MKWMEVQMKTTPEAEEAVSNIFYEEGAQGVVIESPDELLILKRNNPLSWDFYDENLVEMDPNTVIIKAYLDETSPVNAIVERIVNRAKDLPSCGLDPGTCELTLTEVNQDDWSNAWKKYYKPVRVGEKFIIKPTWETYSKKNEDLVIEMDPGMAFGSGLHETTKLCMTNLEKYVSKDDVLIDIGCGSGILSLAAGKLSCKKVIAVDLDAMAVKVAKENVHQNELDEVIEVREGDLMDVIEEEADVIVANILAEVIMDLTKQVKPYLKKGGIFISSGIITEKLDDLLAHIEKEGFDILEVEHMNDWVSIVSKKR
ncbi:MAG TPA: 50S ribosomal protein L11 methyltransferase [Eubacteriaceae bacterium]|nr:50S ribosomal protein L11 methyltransferase [Eubacteriaceae bacterium]